MVGFINILPSVQNLTKFQREEYAKLWFDLSKISIASLVVKLIEPGGPQINAGSFIILLAGLIIFILCVRVGMSIGKEGKI